MVQQISIHMLLRYRFFDKAVHGLFGVEGVLIILRTFHWVHLLYNLEHFLSLLWFAFELVRNGTVAIYGTLVATIDAPLDKKRISPPLKFTSVELKD